MNIEYWLIRIEKMQQDLKMLHRALRIYRKKAKDKSSSGNAEQICNWCGKPATLWYNYDLLCDHCWKYYTVYKKTSTPNNTHQDRREEANT
jgi:hypothetical protein